MERQSYDYYQKALCNGSHIAYLVFDENCVVGAGGVSFFQVMPTYNNPSGTKAYIMNMYTKPEYRRNGIAYKTLDMLIKDIKGRHFSHFIRGDGDGEYQNLSLGKVVVYEKNWNGAVHISFYDFYDSVQFIKK